MGNSAKQKMAHAPMDNTDVSYVVELLEDAIRNREWDSVYEALEFLKEYLDDDGGPIELEE